MKISIKNFQIFSAIFVMILGTLLHFTYEWSGENLFIAAFSAVNESTWEHLKLLFYPMLLTTIIGYFYFSKTKHNFLCANTIGILTAVSFFVIAIYRAIDLNKIIEIKYNKKEIEIGMGLFLISTICLNCNQVWTIVLCWGIAGIYNITQNMQIAKRIIGKFLKK